MSSEAAARLLESGPNELPERKPPGLPRIFLSQFKSPFIYVLFATAVVSCALGQTINSFFCFRGAVDQYIDRSYPGIFCRTIGGCTREAGAGGYPLVSRTGSAGCLVIGILYPYSGRQNRHPDG